MNISLNESISTIYFNGMYFTLNLVTSVGFPGENIQNDFERIGFIVVICCGLGFFALGFSAISELTEIIPEEYI